MEAKGTNKTLKITSEHDSNSIKITKIIAVLILIVLFLSNFAVASFYITFNAEFFFRSNLRATQLMFQFQNKSPLLINTLISNVNRYLNKQPLISYPEAVYKAGSEQFFAPVQEL
jgi:hypothetical protein